MTTLADTCLWVACARWYYVGANKCKCQQVDEDTRKSDTGMDRELGQLSE